MFFVDVHGDNKEVLFLVPVDVLKIKFMRHFFFRAGKNIFIRDNVRNEAVNHRKPVFGKIIF